MGIGGGLDLEYLYSSKANILVNGSPNGYIRYQRGLRQGDPLYPLLFVLVTDVLSWMFTHALRSKILVGVPLGEFGSRYNLHYAEDLLILTMGGLEDLIIVKLMLYLFESIGLATNFTKSCLYSSRIGELPQAGAAESLNCEVSFLPVIYLGVPIVGRRPRRQDREGMIQKVRRRLSSSKV